MANAKKTSRQVIEASVTLTLTIEEAIALRTALAHVGWDATQRAFDALGEAAIPWDEYQEFRPTKTNGCIIAVTG